MKVLLSLLLFATLITKADSISAPTFLLLKAAEHPALDAVAQGAKDTLIASGIDSNLIKTESMQGNLSMANTIISRYKLSPVIVCSIGTSPSQAALAASKSSQDMKIIFASVTDPVSSELVTNVNKPSNTITGVSNMFSVSRQLKLFMQVQPKLKKLGFLYNPSEANSVALKAIFEKECQKLGLSLVSQAASSTAQIKQSTQILSQKCDAIIVSNDNTALSCIPIIASTTQEFNVPLYVSDTDVVEQGAVLAYGPNQYDIGVQAGKMMMLSAANVPLSQQPVQFPRGGLLCINKKMIGIPSFGTALPANLDSSIEVRFVN